jgi:hypothetical protein
VRRIERASRAAQRSSRSPSPPGRTDTRRSSRRRQFVDRVSPLVRNTAYAVPSRRARQHFLHVGLA